MLLLTALLLACVSSWSVQSIGKLPRQTCPRLYNRQTTACPTGWTKETSTNRCMKLFTTPRSWQDARMLCSECRGELVSITSAATNNFMKSLLGSTTAWIGFNDIEFEGHWIWSDGSSNTYTNWASSPAQQPNNRKPVGMDLVRVNNWANRLAMSENCASMTGSSGVWWDEFCLHKKPYVCASWHNPVTKLCSSTAACPTGYTKYSGTGKCFKFHSEKRTFAAAQQICRNEGGNLASFHSKAENWFAYNLIPRSNRDWTVHLVTQPTWNIENTWIGLTDTAKDGVFKWTDNSPFDFKQWSDHDFRKWKTPHEIPQPNNAMHSHNWDASRPVTNYEGCTVMRNDVKWYDTTCTAPLQFLCGACPSGAVSDNEVNEDDTAATLEDLDDIQMD